MSILRHSNDAVSSLTSAASDAGKYRSLPYILAGNQNPSPPGWTSLDTELRKFIKNKEYHLLLHFNWFRGSLVMRSSD